LGDLKEIDLFEDIDVNWELILKWILKKQEGGGGWIILTQDTNKWLDCCEHDDEPSGSIKCGECLDQLKN